MFQLHVRGVSSSPNCMKKKFHFQKHLSIVFWFVSPFCCCWGIFFSLRWIYAEIDSVSTNTLAITVNLWWCFFFSSRSVSSCYGTAFSTSSVSLSLFLSLLLSAVASQDRATVADRRRVGSINRNWTNYEADVPLYGGGRTLSGENVCGILSIALTALVLCCSKAAFRPSHFLPFWLSRFLISVLPTSRHM